MSRTSLMQASSVRCGNFYIVHVLDMCLRLLSVCLILMKDQLSVPQVTWTVKTALDIVKIEPAKEVVVSYLPLSHAAAQMFDMWMGIAFAVTTYFAEPDALKVKMPSAVNMGFEMLKADWLVNPQILFQGSLATTLKEARPTCFLGVPRVWEKMQEKMKLAGAKAPPTRKKVADWAKAIGLQYNYSAMNG